MKFHKKNLQSADSESYFFHKTLVLTIHQVSRFELKIILIAFLIFYSIDQGTSKSGINKTKMKFRKKISNQLALNRIFLRNVLLLTD